MNARPQLPNRVPLGGWPSYTPRRLTSPPVGWLMALGLAVGVTLALVGHTAAPVPLTLWLVAAALGVLPHSLIHDAVVSDTIVILGCGSRAIALAKERFARRVTGLSSQRKVTLLPQLSKNTVQRGQKRSFRGGRFAPFIRCERAPVTLSFLPVSVHVVSDCGTSGALSAPDVPPH